MARKKHLSGKKTVRKKTAVASKKTGSTSDTLAAVKKLLSPQSTAASSQPGSGACRIIYVHGIGNKPLASVLKCQWDNALFGFDLGERSRLAYWVSRIRYPNPEQGNCESGDLSVGDIPAEGASIKALNVDRKDWLEEEIQNLTDDKHEAALLRKLAKHADKYETRPPAGRGPGARALPLPGFLRRLITRGLTRAFLRDVHDLFYVPERREAMLKSVTDRLEAGGGPFVLVAHSQGSMIAYLALSVLENARLNIPLMVTIGSPLGLTEVQDQLKKILGKNKLPALKSVRRWVNMADRLDPVALDATLENEYQNVKDYRVSNPDSPRHPHSATGYLSTDIVRQEVRKAIDVALFQPVGSFVIARDVCRNLENADIEERHEILIELGRLSGQQQTLDAVRQQILEAIGTLRKNSNKQAAAFDDEYDIEVMQRFVAARLTRSETEVLAGSLGDTANRAVRRIWKNAKKRALIDVSISTLQVRPAHNAYRSLGADIHWAVLDTGIYRKHPHFKDAGQGKSNIAATYDCSQAGPVTAGPAEDRHGHGTHVAGIIAGHLKTADIDLSGMAPQALLHIYKVLDDAGDGRDSWIIKALDHIAETNEKAGRVVIQGINLSLGGPFDPSSYACGHSPLCSELRRLWRQGVLVVIAAGNEGYTTLVSEEGDIAANMPLTIGDPANLEEGIAVGSVHKESPHIYGGSYFSSRGPTADGRQKPDVTAPGERILSCRHEPLGRKYTRENLYVEMSGTSMAAPHVSGLLAAYLSVRREFIGYPEKVKESLLDTCTDLDREVYQQGAGMPNLVKMLVGE